MEKITRYCILKIAVKQAKYNLHLWAAGLAASSVLVGVSLCLSLQERGWHVALIIICACIGLFLIGKKTVCPDGVCVEILEAAGATGEQIQKIMICQMAGLMAAAVPAGLLIGMAARPFLPW